MNGSLNGELLCTLCGDEIWELNNELSFLSSFTVTDKGLLLLGIIRGVSGVLNTDWSCSDVSYGDESISACTVALDTEEIMSIL
jgi:hypothetical protein